MLFNMCGKVFPVGSPEIGEGTVRTGLEGLEGGETYD